MAFSRLPDIKSEVDFKLWDLVEFDTDTNNSISGLNSMSGFTRKLLGTVTDIQPLKDGLSVTIHGNDGHNYRGHSRDVLRKVKR